MTRMFEQDVGILGSPIGVACTTSMEPDDFRTYAPEPYDPILWWCGWCRSCHPVDEYECNSCGAPRVRLE